MTTNAIFAAASALDDDFNLFSGKPPEVAKIAELERTLGRELHPEHRALIEAVGEMAVVVSGDVWPPPEPYEIRPYWQMIRGIELFGLLQPTHPLSILGARAQVPADLVPMGKIIGASRYLCATADGGVTWYSGSGDAREPAAGFEAAVLEFLAQLAIDKDRVKREGIKRS